MRLATISTPHGPRAAALINNAYVDLHATDAALPPSVRQLLDANLLDRAQKAGQSPHAVQVAANTVTLLAPIPDPQKIVCLGLNYRDHAAESGSPIPKDPILFSKYPTSLIGTGANIVLAARQPGGRLRGRTGHRRRQTRPASPPRPTP